MVLKKTSICCENLCRILKDTQYPVVDLKKDRQINLEYNLLGLKWKVNGYAFSPFIFCPWCGKEFDDAKEWELPWEIAAKRLAKEDMDSYQKKQKLWEKFKIKSRKNHGLEGDLKERIEEDVPLVYRANIRTFGILKLKKFDPEETLENLVILKEKTDFVPINYCYLCGTKFPEHLDDKLTEILQKEYGLKSWRDYKKAPKEFQTDEWWKKRGL